MSDDFGFIFVLVSLSPIAPGSCCGRFGPISVTCQLNEVDDIDPDVELWEEKDDRPFTSSLNAVTG